MKKGQYADACPKLEAARKLYTSAGILLNLGDCYERIGRVASAWTEFGEAATVAERSNRSEDAAEARRRQEAIVPSLPRLTVHVVGSVPGLALKRDGFTLAEAAWGAALPVDPGDHTVSAEAPGYEPWSTSVSVTKRGEAMTVDIPPLRSRAVAQPATPLTATQPNGGGGSSPSGDHVLAWTLVGGGAAVAAAGGVLMLVEAGRADDARTARDPSTYDAAHTLWTVGLAGVIAGGLAATTGVVLRAMSPRESDPPAATVAAWIQPGAGGLRLFGSW